MKNTLIFIALLLFWLPAVASTPMSCGQLGQLGYQNIYFGFTGVTNDVFALAGSNDGTHWTNIPATWASCGNGSPCKVNAPSPACIADRVYILMADANDQSVAFTTQEIGVLNSDYTVTTLTSMDWVSKIPGSTVLFAGNWFIEDDGSVHIFVPVTTGGVFTNFLIYESHPLTASISGAWSDPVVVPVSGGFSLYDPAVIKTGSNYSMYLTKLDGSSDYGAAICIAQSTSLLGPYTLNTCSDAGGNYANATPPNEGSNVFHQDSASTWEFYSEDIQDSPVQLREMRGTVCNTLLPSACKISSLTLWSQDQSYRHGVVIRTPGAPSGMLGAMF